MKKISIRINPTDLQVLKQLSKEPHKLSDTIRTILIRYLHDNHEGIYRAIYAENRRRYQESMRNYHLRQAGEKAETSTE